MTTWISSSPFTKEEADWIVNTVKVTNIRVESAKSEDIRDMAGNSYGVCVSPSLVYLETSTEQQDTMLILKFGSRLEPVHMRPRYEHIF